MLAGRFAAAGFSGARRTLWPAGLAALVKGEMPMI